MNREQKKAKRRELRVRQKERELAKANALEEEMDEEDLPLDEAQADGEEVEKDYGGEMAYYPTPQPAPTSFEELDAMRLAEEEANAIREVTWDTQSLVRNILASDMLDPGEKVAAMNAVADEFGSRVVNEREEEKVEKDLELLQLEVMIAQDRRAMPVTEYFGDLVTKAVLTSARRNALEDSSFALVYTKEGSKIRKYPIHDKAHVRSALSYAAKQISQGGAGAADARKALPKIRAAAKHMGIGSDMKKDRNAILIEKGQDEKWRWIGWASNNFIDWDGDIIGEKAHQEYVDWWEKNKDLSPVFDTWHIPGTARENPVDTIFYEKGFLIMSGLLTEKEAAGLLRVQKDTDLGMSIGAIGFGRDPNDPRVITKYRAYAITDLPIDNAANPFTDFDTIVKEVGMDKLEYLTQIMGSKEKAEAFLEKTGLKQQELQQAGVTSKELVEKPVEGEPAPADKTEKVEKVEELPETKPETPATVEEIVAQVMKEMDVEGLNEFVKKAQESIEKVPVLEALVKELQGTREEDLVKVLTPPAAKFAWSVKNRATNDDKNIAEEGDPILEKQPGVSKEYWLSEITHTTPVKEIA